MERKKRRDTKKKIRKTRKILIISITAALLITLTSVGIVHIHNRNVRLEQQALRAHYADFNTCRADLEVLVDFLMQVYPEPENRPIYLRVVNGKRLLDPDYGDLNLPDGVSMAVVSIYQKCFHSEKTDWCAITFRGQRIQFDTIGGNYALVYSPGGAPTYLQEEGEGYPILVEQIEGDWYHVTRNG